jgi:hypothetical protein
MGGNYVQRFPFLFAINIIRYKANIQKKIKANEKFQTLSRKSIEI